MAAVDAFHLVEFNREDQVNVRFGLAGGDIAVMETAGSPDEEVYNSVGRLRSLSACCALHLELRQFILFLIWSGRAQATVRPALDSVLFGPVS